MSEWRKFGVGKLNFLLVMPRIVNKVGDGYSFPLGLPYVSASLKKAGFQIYTFNLNHHAGEVEDLMREQIREHEIDVVMTGGLSFQYYPIKQLVDAVKSVDADIPVFVGGGLITGDPEAAMKALEVCTAGIIGEGEITDVELCRALEEGRPLEEVDGLIIQKADGTYFTTPERKEIENIDEIPWPDYDGFELEKSFNETPGVSGMNSTRTIFMLGSRSCPYQCSFCFHTVGRKYRQRSLDNFFEELDYNVKKYHINYVCVADELFLITMKESWNSANGSSPITYNGGRSSGWTVSIRGSCPSSGNPAARPCPLVWKAPIIPC